MIPVMDDEVLVQDDRPSINETASAVEPATASVDSTLSVLSTRRHRARRQKRDQYFLKGPLCFGWIRRNVPDPASRVVLVARAFMDMTNSIECALTGRVWDCAGVAGRYRRRRVLARLRGTGGDYVIVDRKGRPSVMRNFKLAAT
jgi:hypothetical protein